MRKRYVSFSRRLTRRIVLVLTLMLAVVFAIVYYLTVTTTRLLSESVLYSVMDVQSEIVEKVLYGVELSVSSSLNDIEASLSTPETLYAALEHELRNHPHVAGFFAAFEPGAYPRQGRWFLPCAAREGDSIVRQQVGGSANDYLAEPWYQEALRRDSGYWTEPYPDDAGGDGLLCSFAIPLRDGRGRKVGVFGADVSLEWLHQQLQEFDREANTNRIGISNDSHRRAYSFIVDSDGTYIVHPDKKRILRDKFTAIDFTTQKKGSGETEIDGQRVFVCYEDLENTGWTIGFVVHHRLLWLPVIILGVFMLATMLAGLLAVYITSRVTIRRSTKPLNALAQSAEEVAKGNFSAPLPPLRHHDEIYLLRQSFGNMQQSLTSYIEELKATTAAKSAIESELTIARKIQMAMVPEHFPDRPDVTIYGMMTPAKEVGGDLYDFVLSGDRLYFCIGDVSGKGIPAALIMTVTRSLFRTFAGEQQSPHGIMARINATLCDNNELGWFVTMLIGMLDLSTGRLDYCNAGHVPPLLIAGEVSRLPIVPVLAVGSLEETVYTPQESTLAPQTTLFLYTDGLTEAMNASRTLFGNERTIEAARHAPSSSPREVVTAMSEAVRAFVGGAEQSDDLTMLAIQYKGPTPRL